MNETGGRLATCLIQYAIVTLSITQYGDDTTPPLPLSLEQARHMRNHSGSRTSHKGLGRDVPICIACFWLVSNLRHFVRRQRWIELHGRDERCMCRRRHVAGHYWPRDGAAYSRKRSCSATAFSGSPVTPSRLTSRRPAPPPPCQRSAQRRTGRRGHPRSGS